MKTLSTFAAAAVLASANFAAAQVLVSQSELLTLSQIEAGVGAANTDSIEGVALGAGSTIYLVHNDAGTLTVAAFDSSTGNVIWTVSEADIATEIGFPGQNLTLVGEMVYDPTNDRLVMATDIGVTAAGDPWTVFEIDTVTAGNPASAILSSADIQGWNSHDILSDGSIVGVLGEEYEVLTGNEPKSGYIDESGAPVFVDLFDVDDFKAATAAGPGDEITGELPPETVGVDLADDTIYVFGHDNFELLSITGFTISNPSAASIIDDEINNWDDAGTPGSSRIDLHGIDVDGNGNVFGFDEAVEQIVIWDGNDIADDQTGAVTFDELATALGGGALEVTVWRGMKARDINSTTSEVLLAASNGNYGIVRVVVNTGNLTNVDEWMMY